MSMFALLKLHGAGGIHVGLDVLMAMVWVLILMLVSVVGVVVVGGVGVGVGDIVGAGVGVGDIVCVGSVSVGVGSVHRGVGSVSGGDDVLMVLVLVSALVFVECGACSSTVVLPASTNSCTAVGNVHPVLIGDCVQEQKQNKTGVRGHRCRSTHARSCRRKPFVFSCYVASAV